MAAAERKGEVFAPFPPTTALGALINHITAGHIGIIDAGPPSFQPMNINFGLFLPIAGNAPGGKTLPGKEKALSRKAAISLRAARDLDAWLGVNKTCVAE
jgi:methylenetetrahydrofolate--tRNA-(uracil-5-)-methyltransferase